MSFSEQSSVTLSQAGHARKLVSVLFNLAVEPKVAKRAVKQLRDFFASRADLLNKDNLLSSIDYFIGDEAPAARELKEVMQAALTRKQRKVARRLGFIVRYKGPWTPEA